MHVPICFLMLVFLPVFLLLNFEPSGARAIGARRRGLKRLLRV